MAAHGTPRVPRYKINACIQYIIIRRLYISNLGFGISGTDRIDRTASEIKTRTEALAFHGFTETIRGNIPPNRSIIRFVV